MFENMKRLVSTLAPPSGSHLDLHPMECAEVGFAGKLLRFMRSGHRYACLVLRCQRRVLLGRQPALPNDNSMVAEEVEHRRPDDAVLGRQGGGSYARCVALCDFRDVLRAEAPREPVDSVAWRLDRSDYSLAVASELPQPFRVQGDVGVI